jgi:hypothetical protein
MNNGLHSIDNAHQLWISNAVYYCKADSLVWTTRIFLWPLTGFPFHVFSTTGFPFFLYLFLSSVGWRCLALR